jgi:hypothetical protein
MTATEYQIIRAVSDSELVRASAGPGRIIGTNLLDMLVRLDDMRVEDFRSLEIKVKPCSPYFSGLRLSVSVMTDDGD